MKKIIILLIAKLLLLILIYPQDNYDKLFDNINEDKKEDKSNDNIPIPEFKFSIFGDNKFKFMIPVTKDHLDFYGYIKAPRFENELGLQLSYKTLNVISDWQIDIRLNEFGAIDNVLQVKPRENSIKWSLWKFNIKAGFQYFNWGVADKINPMDNLNPKDYRLGFDAEKISLLSAYIGFFPFDFMSIEAVYVPFEQSDKFPKDFKKEIPKQFFYGQSLDITSLPSLNFDIVKNYKDADNENLKFDPSSFLLGGKLNFYFRYIDFSFSYLYDIDPYYTPVIDIKKDQVENTPFGPIPASYLYRVDSIILKRNRIHRIGSDIKATFDRFGLWLEACYSITEDYTMTDYKIRNHNLSWVLGFDFNYGPNNDFYFNLQYIGEYNPLFDDKFYKDYNDGYPDKNKVNDRDYMKEYYYRAIVNNLGTVRQGLLHGLVINLKWPVLDSLLTPSIKIAYLIPLNYDYDHEIRYGNLYINPEFDIMPIDSFHIKIGASLYYSWYKIKGENVDINYDDKIGMFYFNNNIYIAINYKWNFEWRK